MDDDDEPQITKNGQKKLDRQSRSVLFEGASISQLGLLFGQDNRTVSKKLQGCQPCGKRAGFAIYKIKDAAPFLCTPVGDFETYLRTMHHRDLPPLLTKEFWSGQRTKLAYEEELGDLWRTDDVIAKLSTVFQTLRTALLLLSDGVEREVAFTEHQRELLKTQIDATLENMRVSLIEDFEGDEGTGESKSRANPSSVDEYDDEAFFHVEEEDENEGL